MKSKRMVILVGVAIAWASPAMAWPGADAVAELAGCTTTVRNAEMQGACQKCLAKKGQHYHYAGATGFSAAELSALTPASCHRVTAPLPPPPASITEQICDRFALGKKLDACKSCIDGGGWFKPKAGKCEDPDPATLKGAARLDGVDCNTMPQLATESVTRKRIESCSSCVKTGGVFVVDAFGGQCNARNLPDTTMPVADAAGCRDTSVAPLRRRRCTACVATGFGEFHLIGPDAGQCVKNPQKYGAKFKLPEESLSTGLYASCAGVWDASQMLRCRDCLRRDEVFAGGACMKPAAAAKRASKLPNVPASAAVLLPNGGFEVIEERDLGKGKKAALPMTWHTDSQDLLDGGLTVDGAAARTGKLGVKLGSGAALRIQRRISPSTKYKLTYWAKAAAPGGSLHAQLNTERATARGPKTEAAGDWAQVSLEVDSFPGDTWVRVSLVADKKAAGASFVDDVELVAIGAATPKPVETKAAETKSADAGPAKPAIKVETGKNLLSNGGFEQATDQPLAAARYRAPTGWELYRDAVKEQSLAATKDAAHTGELGIRFGPSKLTGNPSVAIKLDVEPGRNYQLVYWVKAVGVTTGRTHFANVKVGTTRLKGPRTTEAATEWTKQTFDFPAGATDTTVLLTFSANLDTTGSYFLDDIELVALP